MNSDERNEASDDRPFPGLGALRDVAPPPSLVPRVMRQVAEPRPVGFWGWLRKPRRIQISFAVSPFGAATALAGACGLLFVVLARPEPRFATAPAGAPPMVATAPAETPDGANVMFRFVLVAKGARHVAVAGDFNGWNAAATALVNADGQGTFVATVPLPRGSHEYMFVVDGEWVTDPVAPERKPDGFGRSNAVLRL